MAHARRVGSEALNWYPMHIFLAYLLVDKA